MVNQGNRLEKLTEYLTSIGIEVNVNKTKARGNKGFFKVARQNYRIDISKNLKDEDAISVLIHEFAHYIHYLHDTTLKSLDFIFGETDTNFENELIELTVSSIPKEYAQNLFETKEKTNHEKEKILFHLKNNEIDIKNPVIVKNIEKEINQNGAYYLLKYDRVRVLECFKFKIYDLKNIDNDFVNLSENAKNYLKLKSCQRMLKRISSKISRLNRYYNSPTELFARSFEEYMLYPEKCKQIAPNVYEKYEQIVNMDKIPYINKLKEIIKQ